VKAAAPAHSEGARVGRNTAFRAAAQAVSALINVGAMVLLGNRLSAAGYGEYAYWYALIPLISSTCDLGAGTIVTREMVRRPADAARTLGDGLLLRALVATLLLALSVASRLMLPAGLLSLVVIPIQSGSYLPGSRCFATSCADLTDTECSSEQPPKMIPIFSFPTPFSPFRT